MQITPEQKAADIARLKEEYEFLLQEIASIRAQQDLASDEIACRWIVAAAEALIAVA